MVYKTVSQIIADFIKILGIKYCFGIPGSNMELLYELNKNGVNLILTKHENNAVFMATGFTKSTGKISSCFASQGPGALNMVEGVAAAYHDSQPILILIGQVPKSSYGKNAFQETSGISGTVNQFQIFKNITKFCSKITDDINYKELSKILKKIYEILIIKKQGPVCLELASDATRKKILCGDLIIPKRKRDDKLNYKKINSVLKILKSSVRVAILCGEGVIRSGSSKLIREISKCNNIPIITTLKGKGIIPENYPLCFGCVGICGSEKANRLLDSGLEVLLAVGTRLSQFTTRDWKVNLERTKIVRIDIDKVKRYGKKEIILKGDAKEILRIIKKKLLISKIEKQILIARKEWIKELDDIPLKNQNLYYKRLLRPQYFIFHLRKYLPKYAILCTESVEWTAKYFQVYAPKTHIVATGLAPIGCSLQEALGAKLANPKKTVVSMQGDGGFNMSAVELITATNYKIPIIAIVLNNGVLGPIFNAQLKKYRKTFMSQFINPDFRKLAQTFKIKYFKITSKKDIKKVIPRAVYFNKKGHIILIDVIITPYERWP
jgi:acetolactate synthase-1/2/3 large subunit